MAGPKATLRVMRARTRSIVPMAIEGLTAAQIRRRAEGKPRLGWIAGICDDTLLGYRERARALAIADPALARSAVLADVAKRRAELRRQSAVLDGMLERVGIDPEAEHE